MNANTSAFPNKPKAWCPDASCFIDDSSQYHPGLSKREYFAAMAIQGLLSRRDIISDSVAAHLAALHADALLAELERSAK